MPCDPNTRQSWWNVPDAAVLELSVRPSDDRYGQDVCWRVNATSGSDCDERWPRDEVTPGPKRRRLTAGERYDLDLRIDFLGETPTVVEVDARIVRADGTQHGSPYTARHSGVKGERCETLLAILTDDASHG